MRAKITKIILLIVCLAALAAGVRLLPALEATRDGAGGNKSHLAGRTGNEAGSAAENQARLTSDAVPVPEAVPAQGVPVLMYHSVGRERNNDAVISPELFTRQMAYLHSHGYHPVSLDQLYAYVTRDEALPVRPVALTFDDGYRDTYDTVLPILRKYGFKSTLFLPGHQVDSRFSTAELQAMEQAGMEVCAHGFSHRPLNTMTRAGQQDEITRVKNILDQKLHQDTRYFCYPDGRYNRTTLSLLREDGYRMAFTMSPGWVHYGDNPYTLRRIWIGNSIDEKGFAGRLTNEHYLSR
ncbi:polysaccharide deacetylase family protein [Desulfotomaculum copahuensis]|uniref:NodB homology domain-containing protein n=1 Tax=Desulfotomaculum copahuensis TaxID=1838280 RepID=A0A1B7LD84_9FIRM|nr:polysaccharide deacetylase family protein [Desulfotomaculum copahuensis]OAT81065.1 hypothetical protein A6M21_12120 [Desulfotomaculum copahuensis]